MEVIYTIATSGIVFLGIAHSLFTFKKYKKIEEQSLWFFSAALGLIFSGFINYTNLIIHNVLTFKIALTANILLMLFSIVLVFSHKKITTFTLFFFALFLLIVSLIYK